MLVTFPHYTTLRTVPCVLRLNLNGRCNVVAFGPSRVEVLLGRLGTDLDRIHGSSSSKYRYGVFVVRSFWHWFA